ncbi:hypothetical protein M1146_08260 [Patescibacteria group bacterium]|nr:hypothetical protein [Patescibacteria group bacterium]
MNTIIAPRRRKLKEDKSGQIGTLIFFFALLFFLMILAVIMVFGSSIINWTFREATPLISDLGVVGDTNFTQVYGFTVAPVNTLVRSMEWLTGVAYFMALVGSIGFVFMMRMSGSRWLMGFYLGLMLILIMGSIFLSNIYEDFYQGNDPFAQELQRHALASHLIIYAPTIFTVIGFITGIILFSGKSDLDDF